MSFLRFAGYAFFLGMLSPLAAATFSNDQQPLVTEPGSFWGVWGTAQSHFVTSPELEGGAAQRIIITPKPEHPWDAGTVIKTSQPVHKGDVVRLLFRARTVIPPQGSNLVLLRGSIYESKEDGKPISPETHFLIGEQWKQYSVLGVATKEYPPGALSAGILLGTGLQTLEFGPVKIIILQDDRNTGLATH